MTEETWMVRISLRTVISLVKDSGKLSANPDWFSWTETFVYLCQQSGLWRGEAEIPVQDSKLSIPEEVEMW